MKRILLIAALLVASPSFADRPPLSESISGGTLPGQIVRSGTLCSAQTATATGCTASGDEIVADFRGYKSVVFYSTQSTSATYTCDVYSSYNGYDADSGVGQDRSTVSLSNAQEAIVLDGALAYTWIECSAIDTAGSTSVTVSYVAVP